MATEQFAINAQTTLSGNGGSISAGATTLNVASAAGFPTSAQYRILIGSEILLVTGGAGTTTWTVTRGAEGTTATSHNDADTVTQVLTPGGLANTNLAPDANFLLNGSFSFAQRQTPSSATSYANGSYGPDRWYLLGSSASTDIAYSRADESASGNAFYSGTVKNNNAASKYTGIAQVIEAANAIPLRGRTVTFTCRVKTSTASRNMRCAILEWTGTKDALAFGGTVGRDPVNNWSSTNYTAGNFFRSTSLTVAAVSAAVIPGTSYATLSVTATVSASCNNLVVMVWEEAATAAAATWNVEMAGLYDGAARDWLPRAILEELALCQRYYEKTYDDGVSPGTTSANGCLESAPTVGTLGTCNWIFKVAKRVTPTIQTYSYGSGATGKCYDFQAVGDCSTGLTPTANSGLNAVAIYNTTNGGIGHILGFQATADAEL